METIEERVIRGFDFLTDFYGPEWQDAIDVENLDLKSVCNCVLGQLEGDYWDVYTQSTIEGSDWHGQWSSDDEFYLWTQEHGFAAAVDEDDKFDSEVISQEYKELTKAWRNKLG